MRNRILFFLRNILNEFNNWFKKKREATHGGSLENVIFFLLSNIITETFRIQSIMNIFISHVAGSYFVIAFASESFTSQIFC